MKRRHRDIQRVFDALGITARLVRDRNHTVWHLTNRHGVTAVFTTPKTPSDWRGMKNKEADLRKFSERTTQDD